MSIVVVRSKISHIVDNADTSDITLNFVFLFRERLFVGTPKLVIIIISPYHKEFLSSNFLGD